MLSLTVGVLKDIVLGHAGGGGQRAWDNVVLRVTAYQRMHFADWANFKGKTKMGGFNAILKKPKNAAARPEVSHFADALEIPPSMTRVAYY